MHDQENTDDWVSNMEILKHLFAISDLIVAEKIFFNALGEMDEVRTRNEEERDIYNLWGGFGMFGVLSNWKFRTEDGQEFCNYAVKKLDTLIKKYQKLYGI